MFAISTSFAFGALIVHGPVQAQQTDRDPAETVQDYGDRAMDEADEQNWGWIGLLGLAGLLGLRRRPSVRYDEDTSKRF